jgi:hemoglobin-like flavoprotein
MTREQRILLRQTFENLIPLPRKFGQLFYQRLFELDPSLRDLFRGELDQQASMLVQALALAVLKLIDEGRVSDHVADLGVRHRDYGVLGAHYQTFGQALVWTLEQRLGDGFTPQLREAWEEAYRELAVAMQRSSGETLPGPQ